MTADLPMPPRAKPLDGGFDPIDGARSIVGYLPDFGHDEKLRVSVGAGQYGNGCLTPGPVSIGVDVGSAGIELTKDDARALAAALLAALELAETWEHWTPDTAVHRP